MGFQRYRLIREGEKMKDKDRMLTVPSMSFESVDALVQSKDLNREEKLSALYNWKQMCELQKASTSEGMRGERTTPYAQILEAIRNLEAKTD
jgi:hypothetical protein